MHHPPPEALACARDHRVLAHLAACAECRAVVAAAARASSAPDGVRMRLQNPARLRRHRAWSSVAACLAGAIVGLLLPVSHPASAPRHRTYLHIDFARTGGYILTEGAVRTVELDGRRLSIADATPLPGGWTAISIKLTRPIRIERECLVRMRVATNAGYIIAELFPFGRDATFLTFSPETRDVSTVTATIRPGENFGTTLKAGDTIDWITIAAPAVESTYMLVHAIELESIP
jgi:hypothetical protein